MGTAAAAAAPRTGADDFFGGAGDFFAGAADRTAFFTGAAFLAGVAFFAVAAFREAALRGAAFFAGFFDFADAALLRTTFFAAFLPFFALFGAFFFFATPASCAGSAGGGIIQFGMLSRRDAPAPGPRVSITPRAAGVSIAIQPLARARAWRVRMALVAMAVGAAALLGCYRLGQAWEAGLRRLDFGDLPLPLLIVLSLILLVAAPLSLLGLAALAFAEESIEVDAEAVTVSTTAFERTRTTTIRRADLECWRETYWPLSPWWTWAVRRLAARSDGRLHPIGAAAGPKEKRRIGEALAEATGRPLIGDFGRRLR